MKIVILALALAFNLSAQDPAPKPSKHYQVCVDTKTESLCAAQLFTEEDAMAVAKMFASFPLVSEPISVRVVDVNSGPKKRA